MPIAIESTRRADLSVGMPGLVPGQEPVKRWLVENQLFYPVRKQVPKYFRFLGGLLGLTLPVFNSALPK
jgi:hypothetical protein